MLSLAITSAHLRSYSFSLLLITYIPVNLHNRASCLLCVFCLSVSVGVGALTWLQPFKPIFVVIVLIEFGDLTETLNLFLTSFTLCYVCVLPVDYCGYSEMMVVC